MTVGIIGAGAIGTAFAKQALGAGRKVILSNSRGPETLTDLVNDLGDGATAGTVAEAAAADIVVISVPWSRLHDSLTGLPDWAGRIVVDTTNALVAPDFRAADLDGRTSSEIVADLVPGARVVKAANTLNAAILAADPRETGGQRVLFVSGDDADAKAEVVALFADAGFATVDLGGLVDGGRLHQFPGGPLPSLNLVKLP